MISSHITREVGVLATELHVAHIQGFLWGRHISPYQNLPPLPPLGFVNNKIAQNLGNTILLHRLALLRFLLGGRLYSIS